MKLLSIHRTRAAELKNHVQSLERTLREKRSHLDSLPDASALQKKDRTDWVARYEKWVRLEWFDLGPLLFFNHYSSF